MIVRVTDQNDVPPRWGKSEWTVEVMEGNPVGEILATLTIKDPDTNNNMAFRVSIKMPHLMRLIEIKGHI